jgi:hypothetical protein
VHREVLLLRFSAGFSHCADFQYAILLRPGHLRGTTGPARRPMAALTWRIPTKVPLMGALSGPPRFPGLRMGTAQVTAFNSTGRKRWRWSRTEGKGRCRIGMDSWEKRSKFFSEEPNHTPVRSARAARSTLSGEPVSNGGGGTEAVGDAAADRSGQAEAGCDDSPKPGRRVRCERCPSWGRLGRTALARRAGSAVGTVGGAIEQQRAGSGRAAAGQRPGSEPGGVLASSGANAAQSRTGQQPTPALRHRHAGAVRPGVAPRGHSSSARTAQRDEKKQAKRPYQPRLSSLGKPGRRTRSAAAKPNITGTSRRPADAPNEQHHHIAGQRSRSGCGGMASPSESAPLHTAPFTYTNSHPRPSYDAPGSIQLPAPRAMPLHRTG